MKKEYKKDLEKETKKRVEKMQGEFNGKFDLKVFENTEGYNQIISQVGIPFSSLCEHHTLTFEGTASIGYIPGKWLVGLSKFARITQKYLNPILPTIQEKATAQILEELETQLKPKGVIVVVEGFHHCIAHRGVKKPSTTITSAITGIFEDDISAKQEFLQLKAQAQRR